MGLASFVKKTINKPQATAQHHFFYRKEIEKEQTQFVSRVGNFMRAPGTGFEESVIAAQRIYESRNGLPIQLCLSGGVDSECMAEAFVEAKVPFEAVFMRFKGRMNEYDIWSNIDYCEAKKIPYKFVDIDIMKFFESGDFLQYGIKYKCQSPQLAAHLWLLDQLDGLPVMGGNPFVPAVQNNQWFYIGLPGDLHCAGFRYFEALRRDGVPWFFLYTPELAASFWDTPVIHDFVRKQKTKEDYSYQIKCQNYNEAGFSASPRQDKYTGFEALRDHYDKVLGSQWGQGFDRLFRKPLEELNPFPDNYYQLVPKSFFQAAGLVKA